MAKKKEPPTNPPVKVIKPSETRYIKEEIVSKNTNFVLIKEKIFITTQSSSNIMISYIIYLNEPEDEEVVGLYRDTHNAMFHSKSLANLLDFIKDLETITLDAISTEPKEDKDE